MNLEALLVQFNLSWDMLVGISTVVLLAVAKIKTDMPTIFTGGWKTQIIALVIAFILSWLAIGPNWQGVAMSTLICWIAPSGLNNLIKKK